MQAASICLDWLARAASFAAFVKDAAIVTEAAARLAFDESYPRVIEETLGARSQFAELQEA